MQPEDFIQLHGVSREAYEKLEIYHGLLLKWQKAINLVSPSTLEEAWTRHFADSAQLAQYIPDPGLRRDDGRVVLADLGSGAGFPGLVLAIMRPDIQVHLVESDERKAQFLRTVSRETTAACVVHDSRIDDVIDDITPDLITARALASLRDLCAYILPWAEQNPQLEALFLKGENAQAEIDEARQFYKFDLESYPSATAEKARILHVKTLSSL